MEKVKWEERKKIWISSLLLLVVCVCVLVFPFFLPRKPSRPMTMDLGRDWPRAPLRRRSEGFFFFFFSPTFFSSLKVILLLLLLGELDDCVFHLRRDFKPVGREIESQSNREENVFWLGDENGNEIFLSLKNFFGSCGKRTNAHHNSKWPIFHLSHFFFCFKKFFFYFFFISLGREESKWWEGRTSRVGGIFISERETHTKKHTTKG